MSTRVGLARSLIVLGTLSLAGRSASGQGGSVPSAFCHITDGAFTTCPGGGMEWSDVPFAFFPESGSYLYADQADLDPVLRSPDSPADTFMLMYDECGRTTPLEPDEYFLVSFKTVEVEDGIEKVEQYTVHIFTDGTIIFFEDCKLQTDESGRARVVEIEGQRGKVGFGPSPNCPFDHVIAEFEIKLSAAGPSVDGAYSPDPIFWSGSLPQPSVVIESVNLSKLSATLNQIYFLEVNVRLVGGGTSSLPVTVGVFEDVLISRTLGLGDSALPQSVTLPMVPGQSRKFVFPFKHSWNWLGPLAPSSCAAAMSDIWDAAELTLGEIIKKLKLALKLASVLDDVLTVITAVPEGQYSYRVTAIAPGATGDSTTAGPMKVTVPLYKGAAFGGAIGLPGIGMEATIVAIWGSITVPFAASMLATEVGFLVATCVAYNIAVDPDSNFTQIATIQPLSPPSVAALPPSQARNVAEDLMRFSAVFQALGTTLGRVEGAKAAGEPIWILEQLRAADNFRQQLENELLILTDAITQLVQELNGLGITLTEQDVEAVRIEILEHGLPPFEQTLLSELGFSSEDITALGTATATIMKTVPADYSPIFLNGMQLVAESVDQIGDSVIEQISDVLAEDFDLDGLDLAAELERGTDPTDDDSDDDGLPDGVEAEHSCLDPLRVDALDDPDADGATSIEELARGSNPCLPPPPTPASEHIIDNGVIQLGVNSEGHLNVPGGLPSTGTGTSFVGLRYLPTGSEATAPGCLCEGWGVADAVSGAAGFANVAVDSVRNLQLVGFESTQATALSIVQIGSTFRVTHDYHPSSSPNLYEVTVTIENISGNPVDVRYRRVMDWDVEPTAFSEFVTLVTIIGAERAANVLFSSDDGFASANPLAGPSAINFIGDAVDNGPDDHGALFDFGFGDLAPGEEVSFNIYYGAAGNEDQAEEALAAIRAEVFSFGQPNTPGGPTLGTPNTFIFAFREVGGDPVFPPADSDADGSPDAFDNCPHTSNAGQEDADCDGIGDACSSPDLLNSTAGFLQAGLDGSTLVEARGLSQAEEPSLLEELARIVGFRLDAGLSSSASALAGSLVASLVESGIVSEEDSSGLTEAVLGALNAPPVCDPRGPYVTSCRGKHTGVQLDGTASTDPDEGDQLRFEWSADCPGAVFNDPTSPTPILTVDTSCEISVNCNVSLTVSDGIASVACTTTVAVSACHPPECTQAVASIPQLWPPNHKFALIDVLGVTDPDDDLVAIRITDITQDEPVKEAGTGSGRTCPDGVLVDANGDGVPELAGVRAERAGNPRTPGNGRVYLVHFTARDDKGCQCSGSVSVCVPHDQGPGVACRDDGQNFTSTACADGGGASLEEPSREVLTLDEFNGLTPEPLFLRGDVQFDYTLNIGDAVSILRNLFMGDQELACSDAADVNDDGDLNISDPISLLSYLFAGRASLPEPLNQIGPDPTLDSLGCE